jgi:hypothetical protein
MRTHDTALVAFSFPGFQKANKQSWGSVPVYGAARISMNIAAISAVS